MQHTAHIADYYEQHLASLPPYTEGTPYEKALHDLASDYYVISAWEDAPQETYNLCKDDYFEYKATLN